MQVGFVDINAKPLVANTVRTELALSNADIMRKKAKMKQSHAVWNKINAKNEGSLLSVASKPNVLLYRLLHYHQTATIFYIAA